jgi:hypothetical protein
MPLGSRHLLSPEPAAASRVCPPGLFPEVGMRADMGKVLVERPRVRAGFVRGRMGRRYDKSVQQGIASGDGSPKCEGMKRRYHGGAARMKHFNEHLGPLRRFIDANVGRPWDKVYAEISRHVDRGNVVQKHILTHLFEYVVVDVELIDGEPYRKARNRSVHADLPLRGPRRWYVCPKSGLLRRAKAVPRRERRKWRQAFGPERPAAWVSKTEFVRRGPGGWELVTVKPWPEPLPWHVRDPRPPAFDVLLRTVFSQWESERWARYYGKRVYAVAVRPIGKAELDDLPITLPGQLTAPNVVR